MRDWARLALAEVVDSMVDGPFGSNLRSLHYVDGPGVRVVRLANIGDGRFNSEDEAFISEGHAASLRRHEVRAGDVLVASLGDENHRPGRACRYPASLNPGIVKADCFRLRLARRLVDEAFLTHQLNEGEAAVELRRRARGVTRDRITLTQLRSLPIGIPSLKEQRRIAEILDAIDEAIQTAEGSIAKLRDLRVALLSNTVWAIERVKPTAIGALAEGDRGVVIGPFGSDLVAADYRRQGVPVVFVQDIRQGELVTHRSRVFVSQAKARSLAAHRIEPGDIAITKMGLPPGIASLYPETRHPGIVTADIIRLSCSAEVCEPAWIAEAINSPMFQAQVRAITGGVTRPKITLRDFRSMMVRMPELSVQREQLALLTAFDARLGAEIQSLSVLGQLRRGLCADLLSGRVRTEAS